MSECDCAVNERRQRINILRVLPPHARSLINTEVLLMIINMTKEMTS